MGRVFEAVDDSMSGVAALYCSIPGHARKMKPIRQR